MKKKTRRKQVTQGKEIEEVDEVERLDHPKVFLLQDLGAILTEMKAMTRAAMSDSMWKLSATRAMELVR